VRPRTLNLRTLAGIATLCATALALAACSQSKPVAGDSWDPKAAAAYLDRRMQWWISWKNSGRDHGTFCFSCHTAVTYALARPALRNTLGESDSAAPQRQLMEDVRRRVRLWDESAPFYTDEYVGPGKSIESRGTEAVLSALMLAWDDQAGGRLSADSLAAFAHMWAQQQSIGTGAGAWPWLDFDLAPWEDTDAQYYGAALAALAVGVAPEHYQERPDIQQPLQSLRAYLLRNYPAQSLHHRVMLLWASTRLSGLLDSVQRQSLVNELLAAQSQDGGWSLSALMDRTHKRNTVRRDSASDGYATGLVALVLEQAAMPAATAPVKRASAWLVSNQMRHDGGSWIHWQGGFWVARSPNKWRNPWSNVGRFMSDAATAYAVLALTAPSPHEPAVASVRK
jgi:squalene-hopene/tetraprenyl-beta-curcumene cyclase